MVFLPVHGSAMHATFGGPYEIERKRSETDYIVHTPDRSRKTQVCHVNMLKPYYKRARAAEVVDVPPVSLVTIVTSS